MPSIGNGLPYCHVELVRLNCINRVINSYYNSTIYQLVENIKLLHHRLSDY